MRRLTMLLLIGVSLLAFSPVVSPAQGLTLSVAISMKEATEELGRRFQESHSGVRLQYNFGASGALQQQIEAGAPVDLFISAGETQMDALERKGLLRPGSRRTFARNALVAVVPADAPRAPGQPADLLRADIRRIAIGNPKTVPAGQYAEESLRSLALWDAVRAKLVYGENVRQVLEYVARGEVEAGMVYATDLAVGGGRVREAFRIPSQSHRPITYPAAIVQESRHVPLAEAFIELLLGHAGQTILGRLGFQPPTDVKP